MPTSGPSAFAQANARVQGPLGKLLRDRFRVPMTIGGDHGQRILVQRHIPENRRRLVSGEMAKEVMLLIYAD